MEWGQWHQYTTQHSHAAAGPLGAVRAYPAGTPCLAARLPKYIALTFENESLILDSDWYLKGIEVGPPLPSIGIREEEDRRFFAALNAATVLVAKREISRKSAR